MKIIVMDKVQHKFSSSSPRVIRKLIIINDDSEPKVLRSSKDSYFSRVKDVGKGW